MDDATRETRRAGAWTLGVCAVLVGLWAVLAGCGPPDDARAAPPAPEMTTTIQEVTDSTAVLRASWAQVDPPADVWRWTLSQAARSGETDSTSLAVEVPRQDSVYAETLCVRGVAVSGSREAEGGEDCASVDVPALALEAPGTPNLQVEIDTTQAALNPDSIAKYDYASRSITDSVSAPIDSVAASWTVLAYRGTTPYICANSSAGLGWHELATLSPEPTIASPADFVPDDEPECGVQWRVEVVENQDPSTEVMTLSAPQPRTIPSEDGGHALLAAIPR